MSQNLDKRSFSINEIIRMYGISRQTVYNEINNGNLTTFKIGRRRLVSLRSLKDWELCLEKRTSEGVI